ncbi:hypothetical protein BDW22DRAFT_455404 [Trametopsis cervina]|nr:hypothetical protein BDW22DRAFT_455404 [Trametopsis cervina]
MAAYTTPHSYHQPLSPGYGSNNSFYQASPYSLPNLHPSQSYQSSPSHNMPAYVVDAHRGTVRSTSGAPVIYQTPSGHQYYPSVRDYAYSDGGRRRRSSSVGHGGHHSSSYYPPPSRSHRSNSHSRSPREYPASSPSHRRSHSHSRQPVYYEAPHHSHRTSSRRPSVSYVCPFL